MPEMQPPQTVEAALAEATGSDDSRMQFIDTLMKARIFVVLDHPWDGESLPSMEMRMLFVTDGANTEQPMLALFTSRTLAENFVAEIEDFKHPVEVDATWATLGIFDGAGAVVNPNSSPNFRLSPEVATVLRDGIQQQLANAEQPAPMQDPIQ